MSSCTQSLHRSIAPRREFCRLSLLKGTVRGRCVPLRLELLKDLALCVVPNCPGLDEAAQVELFRSEHRHGERSNFLTLRDGKLFALSTWKMMTLRCRYFAESTHFSFSPVPDNWSRDDFGGWCRRFNMPYCSLPKLDLRSETALAQIH